MPEQSISPNIDSVPQPPKSPLRSASIRLPPQPQPVDHINTTFPTLFSRIHIDPHARPPHIYSVPQPPVSPQRQPDVRLPLPSALTQPPNVLTSQDADLSPSECTNCPFLQSTEPPGCYSSLSDAESSIYHSAPDSPTQQKFVTDRIISDNPFNKYPLIECSTTSSSRYPQKPSAICFCTTSPTIGLLRPCKCYFCFGCLVPCVEHWVENHMSRNRVKCKQCHKWVEEVYVKTKKGMERCRWALAIGEPASGDCWLWINREVGCDERGRRWGISEGAVRYGEEWWEEFLNEDDTRGREIRSDGVKE